MFVPRKDLFELLSLPADFAEGSHLLMETENGARRAAILWDELDFTADVTETIDGEASEAIVALSGRYLPERDGFEMTSEDNRQEASDRHDPRSAANAIRSLRADMTALPVA